MATWRAATASRKSGTSEIVGTGGDHRRCGAGHRIRPNGAVEPPIGNAAHDRAFAIAATASGVYVAGSTMGTLPGHANAGDADAFVRSYDVRGSHIWTQQFGSSGRDEVLGIAVDASGVYATGVTGGALPGQTTTGSFDAFVVTLR